MVEQHARRKAETSGAKLSLLSASGLGLPSIAQFLASDCEQSETTRHQQQNSRLAPSWTFDTIFDSAGNRKK
jgi:hypothetical protein